MAIKNPVVPSRVVRWGVDNFMTEFPEWTVWGGLTEIADRNTQFDSLTSEIIDAILELEPRGNYTVGTDAYRPDMISHRIYGSTTYWQVILLYNCVVSVGNLVPGSVLKYPSLNDLEGLLLLRVGKKLPVSEVMVEVDDIVRYGGETPVHDELGTDGNSIVYSGIMKTGEVVKLSGRS